MSLEETRDVAIIAYSVCGVIAFLLIALFTLVLGIVSWMTLNRVRRLVKDNVQPTVESVRETSESVRGTVEFVSDYAIMPVIRTYATVAGAREFIAVISRLGRLRRGG